MSRLIDPRVVSGTIMGTCPKCRQPFMGQFDADEERVELTCVSCRHVGRYLYRWPDELPVPFLRHRKNQYLLETSFVAPARQRRQRSKNNPDNVLAGQLKFKGV